LSNILPQTGEARIGKVFLGLWGYKIEKPALLATVPATRNAEGEKMIKRGKILRDANAGPGLLSVDGQHYQFSLEGVWSSAVPPSAGMAVDVEFGSDTSILAITQVPETQIAREQADAVVKAARQKGGLLLSAAIARFGLPMLIATGLLIIGWTFLGAISVQTLFGKLSLTFWQVLGFLNADSPWETVMSGRGGSGAGFYGFLALIALAGPFLSYFWKDKRAALAGVLPLAFMVAVGIMVRSNMHSAMGGTLDGPLGDMQRQAQQEMMSAISLGFGTYLSLLVSLYFTAVAAKQFLVARASETEVQERSNHAAA
jgi:hypothetical protein